MNKGAQETEQADHVMAAAGAEANQGAKPGPGQPTSLAGKQRRRDRNNKKKSGDGTSRQKLQKRM